MNLVVVSGTSRGLGVAIAMSLLSEGYRVLGLSRSGAPDQLVSHPEFIDWRFDLSKLGEIPEVCRRIVDQHGTPFALVNNSALGLDGLLATQSNRDIELVINVNLTATVLLTKYLSRQMLEARRGRIVNISSVVASTGYRGLSVYAATKAALLGFTRSLCRELGPRNITVNSIQPGFMETAMSEGISDPNMEKIRRRSALNRIPELADVAGAVLFLLSEAGKNITGQSIVIDAGNSA